MIQIHLLLTIRGGMSIIIKRWHAYSVADTAIQNKAGGGMLCCEFFKLIGFGVNFTLKK